MTIRKTLCVVAIFALIFPAFSYAQADVPDSKGRDFRFTFMPNIHNYKYSNQHLLRNGDTLYVFVSADSPTSGTMTARNIFGADSTVTFQIDDPSQMFTHAMMYRDYELVGFNDAGDWNSTNHCESVCDVSFHIETDRDVSVYAANQAVTTSDAFIVFPTDALGKNYFVMSYDSHGMEDGWGDLSRQSTPSQFAVVAAYDDTEVEIAPSAPARVYGDQTRTVTLDKGEVYLVQAEITVNQKYLDLTGSEVRADKPVAVFGGHQRSRLPIHSTYVDYSRDCLIQQIPPVIAWGREAFLTPFPQPDNITSYRDSDIFRVLAAYDNTNVSVYGIRDVTLNRGAFYEFNLDQPAFVSADKPILVAQYKKTSQGANTDDEPDSDPFMAILPPPEQYSKFYRFVNIQTREFYEESDGDWRSREIFTMQYATVIAPNDATGDVMLDGSMVEAGLFRPIPGSNYSYAILETGDGVHTVSSGSKIGLLVYGYGYANSYGYVGGMDFKRLDVEPPLVEVNTDCFRAFGAAYDSLYNDSGVFSVDAPANLLENSTVNIDDFSPYPKSVAFSAELIDVRQDGAFTVQIQDSMRYMTTQKFDIPGFTVKETGEAIGAISETQSDWRVGKELCFEVSIENYGNFRQTLTEFKLKNGSPEYSIKTAPPLEIPPGESRTVEICFYSDEMGEFSDTLIIGGDCMEIPLSGFSIDATDDLKEPLIDVFGDSCKTQFQIFVTDSAKTDFGLQEIKVVRNDNCDIALRILTPAFGVLDLSVIDPFQDAFYAIEAVDSAGNIARFEDVIGGFTLRIVGYETSEDKTTLDFGESIISSMNCDSIEIENTGSKTLFLSDVYLWQNIRFSIPPAQLPIEIAPGERRFLKICFRGVKASDDDYIDSLTIWRNCESRTLPLRSRAAGFDETAPTRCEVPVRIDADETPEDYGASAAFPNPADDVASFYVGAPATSNASIKVFNSIGEKVFERNDLRFEVGISSFDLDCSQYRSGMYLLVIDFGGKRIARSFVVGE